MNRSIFCSVLKHIAHLTAEMVFIVLISYRRKSGCQKALCVFHCCCCSITAVIDMIYLPQTNNELSLLFSSSKLPANISAKSDWFYQSYSGNDILCHLIVFDCVYCALLLSWWLMRWDGERILSVYVCVKLPVHIFLRDICRVYICGLQTFVVTQSMGIILDAISMMCVCVCMLRDKNVLSIGIQLGRDTVTKGQENKSYWTDIIHIIWYRGRIYTINTEVVAVW